MQLMHAQRELGTVFIIDNIIPRLSAAAALQYVVFCAKISYEHAGAILSSSVTFE